MCLNKPGFQNRGFISWAFDLYSTKGLTCSLRRKILNFILFVALEQTHNLRWSDAHNAQCVWLFVWMPCAVTSRFAPQDVSHKSFPPPPRRFAFIFSLGHFAPIPFPPPPRRFLPSRFAPNFGNVLYGLYACKHVHVLYSEKIQVYVLYSEKNTV